MRDDMNHTLIEPKRIGYYPGAILEVVAGSDPQPPFIHAATQSTSVIPKGAEIDSHYNELHSCSVTEIATSVGREMDTDNQALVKYSKGLLDDSRSLSDDNDYLNETCFQTIVPEQRLRAADIRQSLDQLHVNMAKAGMIQSQLLHGQQQIIQQQEQTREELLEKLRQLEQSLEQKQQETLELQRMLDYKQEHILQLQQSTKEEIVKKQEELLELQKQTLNRLVVILSHVKALLTQTYELHEYPIPRLFIILPESAGLFGKLTNLFSEHFRLYFLCECGTHTMLQDNKTTPEVHLAKHEGYDVEKPKEFLEKYGSYVIAMMCMIKYGIIAGGVVVPPLANLKILDGLEATQKHMDYLKRNIAPLVDDTIKFLQDIGRNSMIRDGLSSDDRGFDKLEALEGADLRQLESYLKIQDEGRILGNLYRVVTSEGHVKWVCLDHYRTNYRESAIRFLRGLVESSNGTFVEKTGRVTIEFASNVVAKQFYEAMVEARGVHELETKLKWDATMDDIRALCDAVDKANVIHLTIDGAHFKGPAIDVVNRGRRYDPILRLASKARIQSLQLIGFDSFFSRVTKYTLPAPKLRVFSMWKVPLDDKAAIKLFNVFLGHCSGLRELELVVHQQYPTMEVLTDTFPKIYQLESLIVDYGRFSLKTSFRQHKIRDIIITVPELSPINSADLQFIGQISFTRLAIDSVPANDDGDRLLGILRQSQDLTYLRIGGRHPSDTNSATRMKCQDLAKIFTLTASIKLESVLIHYMRFTLATTFSGRMAKDMTFRFDRLDNLTLDDCILTY
ncbi:MAG: hypothetical protein J3Q66DRAFT_438059 [Benniella sp.]|nr:MAG: hypothetical protein J3Q66DRAFT_438059 [Benniella sp.]